MDTLVKKAYENWNQVVEYDGKSLLSFKQLNNASQNELPMRPIEYPNVMGGQMAPQRFAVPVPSQPSTLDPSLLMPGELVYQSFQLPFIECFGISQSNETSSPCISNL